MTLKVNKITGVVDMPNGITTKSMSLEYKFTVNDSNASLPDSAGAGCTAQIGDFWWDSADASLRMYVNDSVGWLLLNLTDSSGVSAGGAAAAATPGEYIYTSTGSFSFVVPDGVTEISAVAIGGGGGSSACPGTSNNSAGGGGGGGLSYGVISVTAG